jgi:predicted NAD-dependent protein-ADP-ribosyltransferase YbiA (DUF1768 family)
MRTLLKEGIQVIFVNEVLRDYFLVRTCLGVLVETASRDSTWGAGFDE